MGGGGWLHMWWPSKSKHAVNTYLRAVPMTDVHDLWHASRADCRRPEWVS